MEIRQVRYFLAVVDNGGVVSAATALGSTSSSVSQGVRALERTLGAELFHRVGRGMVLTSAGQSFVGPARRVVRSATAAELAPLASGTQVAGRLDILASAYVSVHPVAELVGAFRRSYPAVTVRMGSLSEGDDPAALLRQGHCELVFSHLPVMASGLTARTLGQLDYVLVAPPDAELPPTSRLALAELPDLPLLLVPRTAPMRVQIEEALHAAGKRTRVAVVTHHRESLDSLVLSGVGATFMERSSAAYLGERGAQVRDLIPPVRRSHGVVYDPAHLSAAGAAFLERALASTDGAESGPDT
ncbi:putative transcriptional regulator, LysR family [Pseudonocardia sp. Ae168_Ps1]|uniref:LysR family transcriptional regulator n=1 Tax=unclassified Pseudonocardia TaxID=2619320 RepID=UPI00094AC37D|nr:MULTISPECIES: LysR family transcriptional regulator [unclassified Pseudonocardia]OLL76823.1 putative transcriptional regulator, LysR family [Pseudonocardia sp. Ae150A_Ps1]OLL82837.1 putative transcriptional regulator, LysR family [Pseudonocardia sp. Ae168_Ps1]OLL83051.1 putative transcriptional regulator, LysR family [Pseudonocardia sp. Ae263_Ps1]OLL90910.1 putative transcriptional regulator, LysR family [Pseudonocardia sp. Ae356_Ps1]